MEDYETYEPEYTDNPTQETQTDDPSSSEEDNMDAPQDDMADPEEIPEDSSPGSSGEEKEKELTDRLDALIDILTPEEPEESQTGDTDSSLTDTGSEDAASAVYDESTAELLESINGILTEIKADSKSYHEQLILYQEETLTEYKHMSEIFELGIIVLLAVGFFTALSCGCRFADTFFNRMRG